MSTPDRDADASPAAPSGRSDRWLGAALALLALAGVFAVGRNLDWHQTWRALAELGGHAPLVVMVYFLVLSCDTLGWRYTFERPSQLRFWRLWRVRIATEAVSNSLPAGPALAETVKAVLLQRRFGLSLAEAGANVVIAKFALAISQALFLITALLCVVPALRASSNQLLGGPGLEWIAFGIAFVFLAVVSLASWAVVRGQLLGRLLQSCARWGSERTRARLARWSPIAERIDHALGAVSRMPRRRTLQAIGLFFLGWTCLGLENYVILSLLSSEVSFMQAFSMEALLSIVRILFFFVPSALGAQEAGYYLVLRAYGIEQPEVIAAAFMVAKRTKELIWIAAGYATLSSLHVHVGDRPIARA